MKKLNKKGFTIVELVIVIAVIAILAAILVPVLSNIINRAHVANDTTLVRNLNTALAMDTANPKHETMQSALDAAAACGYDVAKINASAMDNMILWDSVNDVFCYRVVDDNGNVVPIGIYVVFVELFDLQGDIKRFKKAVVVAAK